VRARNGVKTIYRDGAITTGTRLEWTQITADRVARIIEAIDRTMDTLAV
jgi:hypothetical protein